MTMFKTKKTNQMKMVKYFVNFKSYHSLFPRVVSIGAFLDFGAFLITRLYSHIQVSLRPPPTVNGLFLCLSCSKIIHFSQLKFCGQGRSDFFLHLKHIISLSHNILPHHHHNSIFPPLFFLLLIFCTVNFIQKSYQKIVIHK